MGSSQLPQHFPDVDPAHAGDETAAAARAGIEAMVGLERIPLAVEAVRESLDELGPRVGAAADAGVGGDVARVPDPGPVDALVPGLVVQEEAVAGRAPHQ